MNMKFKAMLLGLSIIDRIACLCAETGIFGYKQANRRASERCVEPDDS